MGHLAPSACDQCGGTELREERGSLGSFWRRRSVELRLYVCLRCSRAQTYVDSGRSEPRDDPYDDGARL